MISVGASFPDFNLTAVNSNNEFIQVSNNFSKGSWSVIYFYPKDFTFICPTEIVQMDTLLEEAEVLGISGDNEYCKLAWKEKDKELGKIKHSLAADRGLKLSTECGIVGVSADIHTDLGKSYLAGQTKLSRKIQPGSAKYPKNRI